MMTSSVLAAGLILWCCSISPSLAGQTCTNPYGLYCNDYCCTSYNAGSQQSCCSSCSRSIYPGSCATTSRPIPVPAPIGVTVSSGVVGVITIAVIAALIYCCCCRTPRAVVVNRNQGPAATVTTITNTNNTYVPPPPPPQQIIQPVVVPVMYPQTQPQYPQPGVVNPGFQGPPPTYYGTQPQQQYQYSPNPGMAQQHHTQSSAPQPPYNPHY